METQSSERWKERVNKELKAQSDFNALMQQHKLPYSRLASTPQHMSRQQLSNRRLVDKEKEASTYERTNSTKLFSKFIPSNPNTLRQTAEQRALIYKAFDESKSLLASQLSTPSLSLVRSSQCSTERLKTLKKRRALRIKRKKHEAVEEKQSLTDRMIVLPEKSQRLF